MTHAELLAYLQAKPGSLAGYPFDETARVYKVGGKMFALVAEEADPLRVNLKCDPDEALALRAEHKSVLPGYHMNKKHWNTVVLDGGLGDGLLKELIDHSYDLVVAGLPAKERQALHG